MRRDSRIESVMARQVLFRDRYPAIEATVITENGACGVAVVATGTSVGKHEVQFVYDGGERWGGRGVMKAVNNVSDIIAPALKGADATKQRKVDEILIELDGTPNKSRLGGNTTASVSAAILKAGAASLGIPLYQHIGGITARTMPIPIVYLGTGGRYRDPDKYSPSYQWWSLAGVIGNDRELLEIMSESIVNCGYQGKIGIYFDCAADCYYEKDIDRYVGIFSPGEKSRDEMIELYKDFVNTYPIVSFEDPLHEEDFEGFAIVTKEVGIEVVGDDLFTTNLERLKRGISMGAANSMVLKMTQVGTVSEALAACRVALANGYNVHPCGSRGDSNSIGDFAVGLNAGQVRAADHNRLLAIEEELGPSAFWPGKGAYKGRLWSASPA